MTAPQKRCKDPRSQPSAPSLGSSLKLCAIPPEVPIIFTYKNYRGEVAERRVFPLSFGFGTSQYHHGPQWFMVGLDLDKHEARAFALADIVGETIRPDQTVAPPPAIQTNGVKT